MKKIIELDREMKISPSYLKGIYGRRVIGIAAVSGNVDSGGDRIIQGAFAKTIQESTPRIRHLWQHGAEGWDYGVTPPIAAIRSIKEVGREGLTPSVLAAAPEATGGLEVDREYLNTDRANEVLEAYKAGIALEMSIGYRTIKSVVYEDDSAQGRVGAEHWRDLLEIRLFDTSDVNWGMNSATVGSKAWESKLSMLCDRMERMQKEIEAGRIESQELVDQFLGLCKKISGATLATDTDVLEPAGIESRAEPSNPDGFSLTQTMKELNALERELEFARVA